jgi:hypothetical protein
MKISKKLVMLCLSVLGLTCLPGCDDNDNDNNGSPSGTSRVRVSMTDAPGDYDAVNIEVIDVKYKISSDSGEDGWVSVGNITPGVYDLLDLTGGVTVLLADNDIPAGELGQIRLILGDDNTVVIDGVSHPLNTPSAQQSGLKLQVNETLEPNITYNFLVDFDVDQSVVQAGNSGNYNLHPVLRVTTEAAAGAITGTVTTPGVAVTASVTVDGTVVTANTNELGVFMLHGIPSGTYTVTLTADPALALAPVVIENVLVTNGTITNIGNISI